jgi:hypothetical protein
MKSNVHAIQAMHGYIIAAINIWGESTAEPVDLDPPEGGEEHESGKRKAE